MQAPSVRQFCVFWLPPLLLTAGILALSGDLGSTAHTQKLLKWLLSWLPFLQVKMFQVRHGYLRIAGHIAAYASLYYLWFRALRWRFPQGGKLIIPFSLCLCLLTALIDEGHQALVPSRQGRIMDVALDFGAAAVAALALSLKRV